MTTQPVLSSMAEPNAAEARTAADRVQIRESKFEVLRILAMLIIVAHHLTFHSGVNYTILKALNTTEICNVILTEFACQGGKVGVFIFAALSGYFLIGKTPRFTSMLHLWLVTFCYSMAGYCLALYFDKASFTWYELLHNLLPLTFQRYWFITAYFLLFMLSPFMNLCLNQLGRRQYLYLLGLFGVLWYALPTLLLPAPVYGAKFFESEFTVMVYAYAVGAYLHRFPESCAVKLRSALLLMALVLLLQLSWLIVCELYTLPRSEVIFLWIWPQSYFSVLTLALSVSLLLIFKALPDFRSLWINRISALMFGIYLVHENPYLRPYLYGEVFRLGDHLVQETYALWLMGTILAIFVGSAVVELGRKLLLDWLLIKIEARCSPLNALYLRFVPVATNSPNVHHKILKQ